MLDPEEIPTADAVARALVAAARVTGENPLVVANRSGRFRFPAVVALRVFYPECPIAMIGRCAGLPDNTSAALVMAKKTLWWREEGQRAIDAAMDVLEGL